MVEFYFAMVRLPQRKDKFDFQTDQIIKHTVHTELEGIDSNYNTTTLCL